MFFNERLFFPTGLAGIACSSDHRKDVPGLGLNQLLLVGAIGVADGVAEILVLLVTVLGSRTGTRPFLRVVC